MMQFDKTYDLVVMIEYLLHLLKHTNMQAQNRLDMHLIKSVVSV